MTTIVKRDLPMPYYAADNVGAPVPTLNSGVANRLLSHSPLHAWARHPKLNPAYEPEESDAFDLGAAVHAVLLEGREDILAVCPFDNWRTVKAQEFRDEARRNGQIPLLPAQAETVRKMASRAATAIAMCPDLDGVAPWEPETTIIWQHGDTWLRCRPDAHSAEHGVILSYKTTSASAEPDAFTKTLINYGYDLQAAFELDALGTVLKRQCRYVWVVQETSEPYAVSFIGMSPEMAAYARERFEMAVETWAACLESDTWPGYSSRICYVELPAWKAAEWLAKKDFTEAFA